jgi:hypothetical protein
MGPLRIPQKTTRKTFPLLILTRANLRPSTYDETSLPAPKNRCQGLRTAPVFVTFGSVIPTNLEREAAVQRQGCLSP